jgi:hypothetical protein
MSTTKAITPGRYQHYKGQEYEVFEVARHSETEAQLVVYRCLYGDFSWWVRPLAMFLETVMVGSENVPRFRYVGTMSSTDSKPAA